MRLILFYLVYYFFLLWYGVNFLSFSIVESKSVEVFWPLKYILNFSFSLFGKNDFALRLPQIFVSILSVMIFYKLTLNYFKKRNDLIFTNIIFALIPGFIISSLIVNKAIYLIFLSLLAIYLMTNYKILSYFYLAFLAIVDKSFIVFYLGVIFYAIYKKDNILLIMGLIFLTFNANYFNYEIKGKPQGYFLNVFGTYFLIFSPLIFVYFLYSLYKSFFIKKDIIFFIAITAFLISILFSFRQRIKIDDYAPFVLPYIIYMVKIFLSSYRVRLPRFRGFYKFVFIILLISLIVFDMLLFVNRYTPAKKLTSSFYFVKPLVKILKQKKIDCISCNDKYLCKSLEFYGLRYGSMYKLFFFKSSQKVSIFHKDKKILEIDVSNLNTL